MVVHSAEFIEKHRAIETEIMRLRLEGKSYEEIRGIVGRSSAFIGYVVRNLIREGKMEKFYPRREWWKNLEGEKTRTLVEMANSRTSFRQIGRKIGYTGEHVRQIMKLMKNHFGGQIFHPESFCNANEAAAILRVSNTLIYNMLRRMGYQKGSYKAHLINEEILKKLSENVSLIFIRCCWACQKIFRLANPTQKYCSKVCREENRKAQQRDVMNKLLVKKPLEDSLQRWVKEAFQQLRVHQRPEDDQWLSLKEAVKVAGITKMQLVWLTLRKIVAVKASEDKTWRGKPQRLYSKSQMELVQRVYQAYLKNKEQD